MESQRPPLVVGVAEAMVQAENSLWHASLAQSTTPIGRGRLGFQLAQAIRVPVPARPLMVPGFGHSDIDLTVIGCGDAVQKSVDGADQQRFVSFGVEYEEVAVRDVGVLRDIGVTVFSVTFCAFALNVQTSPSISSGNSRRLRLITGLERSDIETAAGNHSARILRANVEAVHDSTAGHIDDGDCIF